MPLLHRKPFVKNRLPPNLKNEEEIFHCTVTNEIFREYDEFFDRLILCNSLVWTCSITGKPGLTYQEAQESEVKGRKTLSNFPEHLPKVILYLASLTKRTRLYDINDDVYSFMSTHYFVDELVEVAVKSSKQTCRILKVISPEEPSEDGLYKKDIAPNRYKYLVQEMKSKKESTVAADKISRKKGAYTRDKSRIFLKSHCEVNKFGQWVVKMRSNNKYSLKSINFTDLFPSKIPKFESSDKRIDSIFNKVSSENAHQKAMTSKLTKTKHDENIQNILVDRNNAREQLKQEKIEEKKKAKEEKLLELKKQREEKLQKEVDLKIYNRPREDLSCDNLCPLPIASDIDLADGVTPEIFAETLSIVEFLNSFHDLFDLNDTFPGGIKFGDLLDSLMEDTSQKSQGLFQDIINFLMQTLFSFIAGEKEDIGSKNANSNANNAANNNSVVNQDEEAFTGNAIEREIEHATKADNYSFDIYGMPIHDIPMDSLSVSEILRLHLESSGKQSRANQIRYYYQQRGAYTPQDDPGIQLKIETDIVSRLSVESLFDFNPTDKLRLLSTLTGQLMTFILTRDCIEDNQEKLKLFRAEQRLHTWTLARREKDESSFWWHKKNDERMRINKLKVEATKKASDTQKKITDMQNVIVEPKSSPDKLSTSTCEDKEHSSSAGTDKDSESIAAAAPTSCELVRFVLPAVRQSHRDNSNANANSSAKDSIIDKDPLANCPMENIDWSTLTPEERLRLNQFNEQRSNYLTNKIAMLLQSTVSLKLGRDRCFRQYYFFRGMPGIYIEENDEHDISAAFQNLVPQITPEKIAKSPKKEANNTLSCNGILDANDSNNHTSPMTNGNRSSQNIKENGDLHSKNSSDKENDSFDTCQNSVVESPTNNGLTIHDMIENYGSRVWTCLDTEELIENLLQSLNTRGHREIALKSAINENKHLIIDSIKASNKKSMFCKIVKTKSKVVLNSSIRTELIWSLFDLEDRIYSGSLGDLKDVVRADWIQKLTDLENNTEDDIDTMMKHLIGVVFDIQASVDCKFIGQPLGAAVKTKRKKAGPKIERLEVLEEKARKNTERWKTSVSESTSFSQLYILVGTLDKSILWERSILQAHCRICRRKSDPDKMLLCDGCNHGHHLYCLKPVMKKVPEGDWFCTECRPKQKFNTPRKRNRSVVLESDEDIEMESLDESKNSKKSKAKRKVFEDVVNEEPSVENDQKIDDEAEKTSSKRKSVGRPKKIQIIVTESENLPTKRGRKRKIEIQSSDDDVTPKKFKGQSGRSTRLVDYMESPLKVESESESSRNGAKPTRRSTRSQRSSSPSMPVKTRRSDFANTSSNSSPTTSSTCSTNGKRKSRDMGILNECSEIVKSLMNNEHSWPFLKPISKRIAPDYSEVIKKKMDFSTVVSKTNNGEYYSDPLAIVDDVKLIFSNCKQYNKEDTEEYKAAHELSKIFDKLLKNNVLVKEALTSRSNI